jgi:hypothetical protein
MHNIEETVYKVLEENPEGKRLIGRHGLKLSIEVHRILKKYEQDESLRTGSIRLSIRSSGRLLLTK